MIDYSYGDNNNPYRTNYLEMMHLMFPGEVNTSINFRESCVNMARSIIDYYPDIEFALSGGIWSFISYMSFVEAGYKPPVKIYQLPMNINQFDVESAKALAAYTGSSVNVIKVSLKDEVIPSYVDIAEKYQTYNLSDAIIARLAELNLNNIFVADSIVLKRNIEPGWRLVLDEGSNFYWHRFNYANRHNIIRSFFTGSPDMLYHFLKLEPVQDILEDRIQNKLSTNTSLKKIFESAGWNLPDRLFLRFTFNDALPEFSKKMNIKITQRMGFKKRFISIPYDKLMNSLTSEGFKCSFV